MVALSDVCIFCYCIHNQKFFTFDILSRQNASASNFFDFLFGDFREESGLDDDGLFRQVAFAKDLEESCAADVDDRRLLRVLCVLLPSLFGHEWPDLVQVDGRAELIDLIRVDVEVPHADLKKMVSCSLEGFISRHLWPIIVKL